MLDLEDIVSRRDAIVKSSEWEQLVDLFKKSEDIYLAGNGGNFAVATHAACDVGRLTDKNIITLDSPTMITSVANDWGYDNIFVRWLESQKNKIQLNEKSLIIGISSSGNSANILNVLNWGKSQNISAALLSGAKSTKNDEGVLEVACGLKYFHTSEILALILFYELIHAGGGVCPTIGQEVVRKSMTKVPLASS
tara:strand:+ start:1884 stop:2468 length:585 start_codon:yes stop_codon:yes gene_type:complete